MSIVEQSTRKALAAMQDALEDPTSKLLESSRASSLFENQISIEDLDRLFRLMAKAAILLQRMGNEVKIPGPWRDILSERSMKCASVCIMANKWPLAFINDDADICWPLGTEYSSGWEYMADLFTGSVIKRDEPQSIKEAAGELSETETGFDTRVYSIKTAYNQQQLARIFSKLVDARCIDGHAPNAQADFLNAFNPEANYQVHVYWILVAKNTSKSQTQILQFVFWMLGEDITPDLTYTSKKDLFEAVTVIFDRSIKSEHVSRLKKGGGKEILPLLESIVLPA